MLTRREVLIELERMGVKEPYLLKRYCRAFENYIKINYNLEIIKKQREIPLPFDKKHIDVGQS